MSTRIGSSFSLCPSSRRQYYTQVWIPFVFRGARLSPVSNRSIWDLKSRVSRLGRPCYHPKLTTWLCGYDRRGHGGSNKLLASYYGHGNPVSRKARPKGARREALNISVQGGHPLKNATLSTSSIVSQVIRGIRVKREPNTLWWGDHGRWARRRELRRGGHSHCWRQTRWDCRVAWPLHAR